MNKTLRIAKREYGAQVRTKGFIIGLAIAPILCCGGLIAFLVMKDHVDIKDKKVAVIDRSGALVEYLQEQAEERNATSLRDPESSAKVRPAYIILKEAPDDADPQAQRLELSNMVRDKKLFAYVEIGRDVVHPGDDPETGRMTYHSENPLADEVRGWLSGEANKEIKRLRMEEAGLDKELVDRITRYNRIESLGLVSVDKSTGEVTDAKRTSEAEAVFVPMGMMMLLFMMMMWGAMPLLSSVLEEKSQRIAEVLLGSIRPFGIMMGKVLGGVAVSLTSLTVYLGAGIFAAYYMEGTDYVPFHLIPWFLLYMISAIIMFGALLSAVGSACNEQSEAQSLMPFVMLPMLIPMFVWFPVARDPLGTFGTVMSLVPPFTPMLMMIRQATPVAIPAWQPWVGLVGMILFTVFCVWAGGRIFRVGLLMQGQPPRIGTLIRWLVKG